MKRNKHKTKTQIAIDELKEEGYTRLYNPFDYEVEEVEKEFGKENVSVYCYQPDYDYVICEISLVQEE